ncbi:MAG: hypothetical protein AAFX52_13735 [Pseudomonadota bacterium]
MQDQDQPKTEQRPRSSTPPQTKEERLAKALRDNLKRRKAKKD